jgi:ligand-binding sensor domain-containing protein
MTNNRYLSMILIFILIVGSLNFSCSYNSDSGWTKIDSTQVISLTTQGTNIWAISRQGVFKIDINSCQTEKIQVNDLAKPSFNVISKDLSGNIWVGSDQGISLFNRSSWTNYSTKDGLISNNVISIFVDKDGTVLVGFDEKGINGFVRNEWERGDTYLDEEHLFPVPSVRVFAQDSEGVIWLGANDQLIKNLNGRPQRFTTSNGLPSDTIISLLIDDKNHVWAGTDRGLGKYNDNSWEIISGANKMLSSRINALFMDSDNGIWVVTQIGLAFLKDNNLEYFTSKKYFADASILSIIQDSQKRVWIGTEKGLYRYDNMKSDRSSINN